MDPAWRVFSSGDRGSNAASAPLGKAPDAGPRDLGVLAGLHPKETPTRTDHGAVDDDRLAAFEAAMGIASADAAIEFMSSKTLLGLPR